MQQTTIPQKMELALQKPDYTAGKDWWEIWSDEHKQQRIQSIGEGESLPDNYEG